MFEVFKEIEKLKNTVKEQDEQIDRLGKSIERLNRIINHMSYNDNICYMLTWEHDIKLYSTYIYYHNKEFFFKYVELINPTFTVDKDNDVIYCTDKREKEIVKIVFDLRALKYIILNREKIGEKENKNEN